MQLLLFMLPVIGFLFIFSWRSRIVVGLAMAGSYLFIAKAAQNPSSSALEIKASFALVSLNIGLVVLATVFGLMKRFGRDAELYERRKRTLLMFLGKWAVIYSAFGFVAQKVLEFTIGGGVGWAIWQLNGLPIFLTALCIYKIKTWRR